MKAGRRRVLLTLCAGLLGAATDVTAQRPGTPRDTMRFRETMRIDATSRGRAGRQEFSILQDARIAVAQLRADSMVAWYDSLSFETIMPTGSQTVPTATVLRAPFVLRLSPRGAVHTLRSPTLPGLMRELADLVPQFEDFFPRLPSADLAVGGTRTDTILRRETGADGRRLHVRRVIRFRTDRDTVVNGEPAVWITTLTELHIESTRPIQAGEYRSDMVLSGIESGAALVLKTGRLVSRDRSGDVRGATTYRGAGADISVDQTYRYRGTITAVLPEKAPYRAPDTEPEPDYPHTFSILAYDPATGEHGGAVQSRVFSVGNGVLWAEAGVGIAATQAIVDVSYGPQALALLREGKSASEIVQTITSRDPDPVPGQWTKLGRQFAVVDAKGNVAAYTGPRASAWAGDRQGVHVTAQGNILAGPGVVDSMLAAFDRTTGHLALRLMAALEGGQRAGGDIRGMQSAAMLIVKKCGGVWLHNDVVLRLQVDDNPQPIAELRRLVTRAPLPPRPTTNATNDAACR